MRFSVDRETLSPEPKAILNGQNLTIVQCITFIEMCTDITSFSLAQPNERHRHLTVVLLSESTACSKLSYSDVASLMTQTPILETKDITS